MILIKPQTLIEIFRVDQRNRRQITPHRCRSTEFQGLLIAEVPIDCLCES